MDAVATGVDGLDEMLGGGIPRGHVVALLGSFGTGKTTLALQFLMQGLINGDKGIFITLEEDVESILRTAAAYGWDLRSHVEDESAALIKLEPADAKVTATRVRAEIPAFIRSFGAQRIAIDSVSLLTMMFPDEAERRTRLFALCDQIRKTGATAVMTAEVKDENPRSSRDGLVEYVSDGVISLRLVERSNGEVQPAVQVVKMRRSAHSRNIKPYSLTDVGIVVHTEAEVFA
ncbi:MAG TPA: KaiC domain-containing protein [Thermoplasmata archaeon]|nr:KaiC domain-containing protein [Thermoplasmata archaeon]